MEYYSAIKKNEIVPFRATWTDLEIITLSEVSQRQTPYGITYMWNLKYDTNELIQKTEITHRHRIQAYCYKMRKMGGINKEFEISRYILL